MRGFKRGVFEIALISVVLATYFLLLKPFLDTYIPSSFILFPQPIITLPDIFVIAALTLLTAFTLLIPSPEKIAANVLMNPQFTPQNIETPSLDFPVQKVEREIPETGLESLLAALIKANLQSVEILPEIELKHEGSYRLLGKTWDGKITLTIKPKEKESEEEEKQLVTEDEEDEKPF